MGCEREIMIENKDYKEDIKRDFRMRWQITIDDIRYIKNRQWTVTYYLLLLFAAIIGFYEVIIPRDAILPCWQRVVLFLVAIYIAGIGTYFLREFQKTAARYRKRLVKELTPSLSLEFQKSEEKASQERYGEGWEEKYTSEKKDRKFTIIFCSLLYLSLLFLFYYLFLRTGC